MSLLASASLLAITVIVGVVVAAFLSRIAGIDPTATFAAVMAAAVLAVAGYVLGAGFGLFAPVVALSTLLSPTLVVSLLASVAIVRLIDRPQPGWGHALRSRLLLGVPWGTLVAMGIVLAVYLFLQHGRTHWSSPVTVAFRAWSYEYPLGILTSGFAHNGPGHLIGNLIATVIFGTMAEYGWGHYPERRGRGSFESPGKNPWIRAFVIVPGAILVTGVLMGVFSMGPVIGFSGVTFALLGFALVRYPIAAVAGTVVQPALWHVYLALIDPIFVATPAPSPPTPPGWATIAIQIHALGLLVGIAAGAYVFSNRDRTPSALRLWTGLVLIAMAKWLWALYWFRGNNQYVLYRGPGIVIVASLVIIVVAALAASNRSVVSLVPRTTPDRVFANGAGGGGGDRMDGGGTPVDGGETPDDGPGDGDAKPHGGDDPTGPRPSPSGPRSPSSGTGGSGKDRPDLLEALTYRNVAVLLLILMLGIVAGFGAASNVFTVGDTEPPETAVQIRDYDVYYAEDVTNRRVAVVNLRFYNETTQVRSSGVIVASQARGIWITAVTRDHLAFTGHSRVRVGGVGWEASVLVSRNGWEAVDGPTAYKVFLRPENGERRLVYVSESATAGPVIRNHNVSIRPTVTGYNITVSRNGTPVGTAEMPGDGESVTVQEITFVRRGGDVYAVVDGTRVKVFSRETYE